MATLHYLTMKHSRKLNTRSEIEMHRNNIPVCEIMRNIVLISKIMINTVPDRASIKHIITVLYTLLAIQNVSSKEARYIKVKFISEITHSISVN